MSSSSDFLSALLFPAIRFGRMPQSEKLKLKAEMVTGDREVEANQKTLARQIYEAYLKNFNMNKAKARTILTGKTSTPVRCTSEIMCKQQLAQITCSISSASQHTSCTRPHLLAPN